MTQQDRRAYLLTALLRERPQETVGVPSDERGQKLLLRALLNLRPPAPASEAFLDVQDAYLREEIRRKGVTTLADLDPIRDGIYLWRGDITTLACDAIVNAANSGMTGCYVPCHDCIDNCIHTYAGVQLRLACAEIMEKQGHAEEPGGAKITPAFNLPCRYVLHTVGPIVRGPLTERHCELLASCYRSCLELAVQNRLKSVAFCCISTGVFAFPGEKAAEIAVRTVDAYRAETGGGIEVIFNVFTQRDEQLYRNLLGTS